MSALKRFRIVLKASRNNVPLFIAVMQAVCAAMTANASSFPSSPVQMAIFKAQVDDLAAVHLEVRQRVPGAAAKRKLALDAVCVSAEALRAFVSGLAILSPEQAETLAHAAGMHVAAEPVRTREILKAKQGPQPGTVKLFANVALLTQDGGSNFFNWEFSVNGGTSWVAVPSTPRGSTTITGLPVLTECSFRVSVTSSRTGLGAWSQVLKFLVH